MKKKITIIVCSILIILLIALYPILIMNDGPVTELTFTETVTVEAGVPNPSELSKEFVVEEEGEYRWVTSWKGDPGMLTGVSIKSSEGDVLCACTAEGCYAEYDAMELKAGTYEVTLVFLTNNEALENFMADNDIQEAGDELYTYKENGTWTTEYMVGLDEAAHFSIGVKVAFVIGLAIGLLVVAIMLAVTKKGEETKSQFDERQELVRGRGFKYGFFTMMIVDAVLLFMDVLEVALFSNLEVAMTLSIIIGVAVFASYCIWNDGYFALNENRKSLLIVFGLVGVLNVVIAIVNLAAGLMLENGALTFRSCNLFCALLFLVIFVVLLMKQMKDRKDE